MKQTSWFVVLGWVTIPFLLPGATAAPTDVVEDLLSSSCPAYILGEEVWLEEKFASKTELENDDACCWVAHYTYDREDGPGHIYLRDRYQTICIRP